MKNRLKANFFGNIKVGHKILSGYLLIIILMVATTVYSLSANIFTVDKYVSLVERNLPVIQTAEKLRSVLLDMQSSFRGFVITGKPNFISHYSEGKTRFDDLMAEERKLVSLDPKQVAQLDEVQRLKNEWIRLVAEPGIAKRRVFEKSSFDSQQFLVEFASMLSSGKSIVEEIRTKLEVFIMKENEVIDRLAKNAAATNQRMTYIIAFLNGSLIVVALLIGFFTSYSIQKPLEEMSRQMELLTKGGADLSFRMPANRRDEIGELGANFNRFMESLATIMSRLAEGSVRLASASEEIGKSSKEMTHGAESQLSQVLKTSSAMEQMSATIQEVSRNARTTADSAVAASNLAREGSEKLESTLQGMTAVDESVRKLHARTSEIGRVVQLISGIAAQTNILALNAAIEAARAGEYGRGFDVVAEEIRKLSLRTTESTVEIASVIEEIQMETDQAAGMMQIGAQMASDASQTLSAIVESVVSTTDMIGMISSAASQQSKTAEQIAEAFQSIAQVSDQSTRNIRESSKAMADIVELSYQLKEITSQFKL